MKVKVTQLCLPLWEPMDYIQSTDFSRPEYWSGPAPGGICPTQGSNPGLPHWRRIPYQLSHKGSPRILGWVAYPFSSWSSWPRNQMNQSSLCCRQILYQLGYQGRSWYWQYLTKFKINIILRSRNSSFWNFSLFCTYPVYCRRLYVQIHSWQHTLAAKA